MSKRQVQRRAIFAIAFLFMFVSLGSLSSCSRKQEMQQDEYIRRTKMYQTSLDLLAQAQGIMRQNLINSVSNPIFKNSETERVRKVRLAIVGDLMFHNTQLTRAYQEESKTFDFHGLFDLVAPYLQEADLCIGNLETTLYGPYGEANQLSDNNIYGYSGYPRFNTPDSILTGMKEAGFDFLLTANNHSLDRGYDGMIRTIEKLQANEFLHTGTFLSKEERKAYEIVEVNGIRFAVVNYTYATNGLSLSKEQMELINTLDLYQSKQLEQLYQDLAKAQESDAHYVIAALHFGNEYQSLPSETYQKKIAYEAIRKGADFILGSHPHVLQPIELVEELDGIVFEEPKFIIYSLGNFIASQRNVEKIGGNTDVGVILGLDFRQIDRKEPEFIGFSMVPTYTLWQSDRIMTIPVIPSIDVASGQTYPYLQDFSLSAWDKQRLDFASNYVVAHLTSFLADSLQETVQYDEKRGISYIFLKN